jgi:ribonuclease VapC
METVVVDSSVLVAVMNGEPEAGQFQAILSESVRIIGWPTVLETRLWAIRRQRPAFAIFLDHFLAADRTDCRAFGRAHEHFAREAFSAFGKGRHSASLNFGDCMTYAVSKVHDVPLLFKGGDFGLTDVKVHPASVVLDPSR